jgi:hypothetical protein
MAKLKTQFNDLVQAPTPFQPYSNVVDLGEVIGTMPNLNQYKNSYIKMTLSGATTFNSDTNFPENSIIEIVLDGQTFDTSSGILTFNTDEANWLVVQDYGAFGAFGVRFTTTIKSTASLPNGCAIVGYIVM